MLNGKINSKFSWSFFALLFGFALSQINLFAQEPLWEKVQTGTTLGGRLEQSYSTMLNQCNPASRGKVLFERTLRPTLERSAIPRVIQTNLALGSNVWAQNSVSMARIFASVYTGNDLRNAFNTDDRFFLYKKDLVQDPATMMLPGGGSIIYSHNCSGVISAALKAKAGYSIPIASVESALQAEYSGEQKMLLSLISGQFTSPFGNLLYSPVSSSEKLSANLTLWNWYASRTELINPTRPNYIVTSFTGVALFESLEQKRDTNGSISASGGVAIPFASVDSTNKATYTNGIKIDVKKYSTFAFLNPDGTPQVVMNTLPNPTIINRDISTFTTELSSENRGFLVPNVSTKHTQVRDGVPQEICNTTFWTISPKAAGQNIQLSSAKAVQSRNGNLNISACEFVVSYTPTQLELTNASEVRLNYSFVSKNPLVGVTLELKAQEVPYATSRSPQIFVNGELDPRFTNADIGGGRHRLSWTSLVDIDDADGVVDWSKNVERNELQIVCDGSPSRPVNVTSINPVAGAGNRRTFAIVFTNIIPIQQFDPTKTRQCKLSGTLRITRNAQNGGQLVERSLPANLEIDFPQVATPAVIPPSTPTPTPVTTPTPLD